MRVDPDVDQDGEDPVVAAERVIAAGRDDDDATWADVARRLMPKLVDEIRRLRKLAGEPSP